MVDCNEDSLKESVGRWCLCAKIVRSRHPPEADDIVVRWQDPMAANSVLGHFANYCRTGLPD